MSLSIAPGWLKSALNAYDPHAGFSIGMLFRRVFTSEILTSPAPTRPESVFALIGADAADENTSCLLE